MLCESELGLIVMYANSRATARTGGKKYDWWAKKREKIELYKISVKTTKGRKRVEDKNKNKEWGQQIEKDRHGR